MDSVQDINKVTLACVLTTRPKEVQWFSKEIEGLQT